MGTGIFCTPKIASAVKIIEFVSNRVSYIDLRGRWCNIIVLNVHAPSDEKSDESKDSFYEELEQVFYHFPKYHMKFLLGDFNLKVGREKIFKPTIGNEILYQYSNNNGVRIVNFATKKNYYLRARYSPTETFVSTPGHLRLGRLDNQIDHILIDRRRHSSILDVRSFRGADCDTDNYLVVAKLREN